MVWKKSKIRGIAFWLVLLFFTQINLADIAYCYIQDNPDLREARELYKSSKYGEAIPVLEKLTESEKGLSQPQLVEVYQMLAYSYYYLQQEDKALKAYGELLLINPNYKHDPVEVPKQMREFFNSAVGALLITSQPQKLEVVIDGRLHSLKTPNLFKAVKGQHKIELISPDETKYKSWQEIRLVQAGQQDNLEVKLEEQPPAALEQEPVAPVQVEEKSGAPVYKKLWFWASAAAVAAAGVTLAILSGSDSGPKTKDLPSPPSHPK